MKIAVCVKQVPDSDNVRIDKRTGTLIRSEVPGILNPADVYALRLAADLADQYRNMGEEVTVTALTMGPPQASAVLRESMARGADEGVLLGDRAFAGADTWATSLTLAAAVKKMGDVPIVIAGRQSTDGETGHIGPQLAEHLGYAQVTMATGAAIAKTADTGSGAISRAVLRVGREMDGRRETLEVTLPAVLSVKESGELPSGLPIGKICDAYEGGVTVWDAAALSLAEETVGLAGSMTAVRQTYLPEQPPKGEMLNGNARQTAKALRERLVERHLLD